MLWVKHKPLNGQLSKLWEIVKDREAWQAAAVHGVAKSRTRLSDEEQQQAISLVY